MFRYGNMTLRVMSGSHFKLVHVASPKKAELAVAHFRERYLSDRGMKDANNLKNLLSTLVRRANVSE
jgi:hypothetical protein